MGGLRRRLQMAPKVIGLYRNWSTVFGDRLHLLPAEAVVYRLRNGVQFAAHTRSYDRQIIDEIFIDHAYTWAPGFNISDGWVVADIGGHKGMFAVFAATQAKNVKVFTFEPSAENFAVLKQNLQRNGLPDVKVFNVAVSGRDGEAILHLHSDGGQNSLLERSEPGLRCLGEARVEGWSLKRVLEAIGSRVDLLKMDIEGMEYEALMSCATEDLQKIERMAVEYHDALVHTPCRIEELVRFLKFRGFATRLHPERPILSAERLTNNSPPIA